MDSEESHLNSQFERLSVRLERIVHFDTMLIHEKFVGTVRDVIEAECAEICHELSQHGFLKSDGDPPCNLSELEDVFSSFILSRPKHGVGFIVKA